MLHGSLIYVTQAISPILDRHASGLVHLVMSASLQHTPLAALSRPIAGTRGNTLIVTLPGSVKAVKENLAALLTRGLLEHAVDLVRGGTGRAVHTVLQATPSNPAALAQPTGQSHEHHHHHHHHAHGHQVPQARTNLSHDPSLARENSVTSFLCLAHGSHAASARHRISPYPIISFKQALELVVSHVLPLEIQTLLVSHAPCLRRFSIWGRLNRL
jgi:gephyrin